MKVKMNDMNNTLNSIFVRLDVNLQNLTSKAIAQIIVKILYSNDGSMSKAQIKDALAQVNGCAHLSDMEIDELLDELSKREIRNRNGQYYLSTSKKTKLQESVEKSVARKNSIINRFFNRMNSSREIIENWLVEATIKFFETFSEEWISDLKAGTQQVAASEESIRALISNRTNSIKELDSEDKKVLPGMFFNFVNTSDSEVDEYLWEYGTSAFASKLIRTIHGVDELTIETFRNSHCILDTNILMFIALESRYKDAFVAIEKVFVDLGVKCSILYITKEEYESRVGSQKSDTLNNLEKFGYDITALPNDDFTTYAKTLRCKSTEDFIRFFDTTLKLPEFIHDKLKINLLDDDRAMLECLEKAQKNEDLKAKLNEKFKAVTGHDKAKGALRHDIGLLEGVRFLRNCESTKDEKFFILSEEVSINQYSKDFGFRNGLPLSLRVDTLINLLAVNNGGDTFDAADYMPLFANIIRLGLTPHKDTFRQSELFQFYKMNTRIASLPKDTTEEIVLSMHKKMLDGVNDDDLLRDFNEMVTDGEIKSGKALEEAQDELSRTSRERDRERAQNRMLNSLLMASIMKNVSDEYDKETKRLRIKYKRKIPGTIIAFLLLLVVASKFGSTVVFWISIVFSVLVSIVATMLCNRYAEKNVLDKRRRTRDTEINRLSEEEFQKRIGTMQN